MGVWNVLRGLRLSLLLFAVAQPVAFAQQPTQGSTAQQLPPIPEAETLAALIRWTLLALSQANLTGNYTVLRDLGSPDFQSANSSAKLAMVFAGLREQKLDLTFVALAMPQLSAAPAVDGRGVLRVAGYYPTTPLQVNFDLSFQAVAGTWRHSEIALAAGPPMLRVSPAQPLISPSTQTAAKKQPAKDASSAGNKR